MMVEGGRSHHPSPYLLGPLEVPSARLEVFFFICLTRCAGLIVAMSRSLSTTCFAQSFIVLFLLMQARTAGPAAASERRVKGVPGDV